MRRLFLCGLLGFVVLTGACRRDDEIQTYRISKEETPAMPMAPSMDMPTHGAQMGLTAAATPKDISWKTPPGWQEQAPSSMRVGSFLVKGQNGHSADVSVIPLSGDAGGDLANINRWRGQINLPDLTARDLSSKTEKISPAGRSMILVDFTNHTKRLIAAIYQQGGRSWFFKMLGDDATVEAAKPAFLQFLKSLRFGNE